MSSIDRSPVVASRMPAPEITASASKEQDGSPGRIARRVLLVDDNADSCELYQMVLELEGHIVTTATDGNEALALLLEGAFDVAVLDIGLPGIDGYALARLVSERLGERAPLLIAMTGYGAPQHQEAVRLAGFAVHLVKPIEPAVLTTTIATQVK